MKSQTNRWQTKRERVVIRRQLQDSTTEKENNTELERYYEYKIFSNSLDFYKTKSHFVNH